MSRVIKSITVMRADVKPARLHVIRIGNGVQKDIINELVGEHRPQWPQLKYNTRLLVVAVDYYDGTEIDDEGENMKMLPDGVYLP